MTFQRRRLATGVAALLAGLLVLAGCGQVEEEQAAEGATIETMFGPVTVPADPQRVVALGWSDAEAALALGVQPVGVSDWIPFGGNGVGPWADDLVTEPPTILGTLELSYEQISSLEPDLILNTRSDNSREKHDELSKIAPTVSPPPGVVAYGTTWVQQTEMVAAALGKQEEGARQIAEVEQAFADARAAHPEFEGKTVAVGAYFSDQYGGYVRGDARVDFMESLGFVNKPEIQAQAGDTFFIELAREQIEQLSADLTVMFPIGGDATPLREDPVLNQIPSARAGNLLILDDEGVVQAFSAGSVLSTRYAIDNAVPIFADALS
ncbi:iron-siderophore ABC transporter substrate-binding protein [Pseudonocardia sp. NPDC049635]|uniref:iron-siderophore ABC transporter substrate-binding protein n=1 Tax=Pseudonocardia sp. NPDC049635 TaxID=3155506 RepID=UPI0033D22801